MTIPTHFLSHSVVALTPFALAVALVSLLQPRVSACRGENSQGLSCGCQVEHLQAA